MRSLLIRRERKPAELLLVPMIDIFTVLVTFLLMTAVFSRIAIMQIDLPSSVSAKPEEPKFRLEVIVRQDGFELSDGKQAIGTVPKVNSATFTVCGAPPGAPLRVGGTVAPATSGSAAGSSALRIASIA